MKNGSIHQPVGISDAHPLCVQRRNNSKAHGSGVESGKYRQVWNQKFGDSKIYVLFPILTAMSIKSYSILLPKVQTNFILYGTPSP